MSTGIPRIGDRVLRTEDHHLVTGRTAWAANVRPPGTLHLVFVRSHLPHAHVTVDVSAAREAVNVVAAWTGGELAAWCAETPRLADDEAGFPLVALDTVRYVGEAVAVVVARTEAAAVDAAELVEVDYRELPAVADAEAALAEGAIQLHQGVDGNVVSESTHGSGDVAEAFRTADVVVRRRFVQPRVFPAALEPRAAIAQPDADGFTVWVSTQTPHVVQLLMAEGSGIPADQIRVVAADVGGGFGGKFSYPEELVVLLAARALNRPVSWVATRSEDLQTTYHGRAIIQDVAVASTDEGRITGLEVDLISDVGGYSSTIGPGAAEGGVKMYPGAYQIPNFSLRCRCVLTSKTPVAAYRGAGRPEATYAIERIVDELAAQLELDPVELRRRNWIRPDQFPYKTAGGVTYDVGDYAATADAMLELSDYADLRRRQAKVNAEESSKRLGLGVSTYVEVCGAGAIKYDDDAVETSSVRLTPQGAEAVVGSTAYGTGHVTSWKQIVGGVLGLGVDAVAVVQGDTRRAPHGFDSYGSRSVGVVGAALHDAAVGVRARASDLAARLLECDPADLELDSGVFTVRGTTASKTLHEVTLASYDDTDLVREGYEPGLGCTRTTDLDAPTFPAGAHLAVVEVDTETGFVELLDYVGVDDVGNVVNPMIVEGQVHGGVVQGIAQALFEEAAYDDDANVLTPSFTEYAIPSAADLVQMRTDRRATAATHNALGTKGVGEAGAIAAPPAIVNAVLDALRPLGVVDVPMPCTPHRVWTAIHFPDCHPLRRSSPSRVVRLWAGYSHLSF